MDLFSLVARLTLDKSAYDSGIDEAEGKASSFGSKLKSGLGTAAKVGGAALTAASTAVVAFGKESVSVGANFDASMAKVAAISGATGDDLEALRNKAQDMGASTMFSASQAADALSYMAMAGWKTGEMLGGIEGVMNLAAASGEDLAMTSDIVTDALTAFGLKASDSAHFADVLAAASSNANTNVSMMGETFKYAAPLAGALGFSAEDTAEAIGLMANAGIKGSQAGTSLRMILNQMTGPIDIAGDKLGKMTVETQNADGTMRDMSDILDDLRGAFSQLSESEKASAAESIAGKNAMSGFLALMNAGQGDIDKLRGAITECDGAAEEMAATMQDNLAGDITIFKSALEGAQIAISDGLMPELRKFVQFGTSSISTLTTAFREDGLAGAMSALGTVISDGLALVMENLPLIVEAGMQLLMSLISGIIDNLPLLVDAAVQIVLSLAQMLTDNLPELIPTVVDVVLQIVETLTEPTTLANLIDAAVEIIVAIAEGMIKAVPKLTERVPEIILNVVEAIIRSLPRIVEAGGKLVQSLAQGIVGNVSAAVRAIGSIGSRIAEGIGDIVKGAADWGRDMINNFTEGIKAFINKPIDAVKGLAGKIKSFLGFSEPEEGPLSNFHTFAPDMMALFAEGIKDNRGLITDAIGESFNLGPTIAAQTSAGGAGEEIAVPRGGSAAGKNLTVILQIGKEEFARVVTPLIEAEQQRVGLRLSTT